MAFFIKRIMPFKNTVFYILVDILILIPNQVLLKIYRCNVQFVERALVILQKFVILKVKISSLRPGSKFTCMLSKTTFMQQLLKTINYGYRYQETRNYYYYFCVRTLAHSITKFEIFKMHDGKMSCWQTPMRSRKDQQFTCVNCKKI